MDPFFSLLQPYQDRLSLCMLTKEQCKEPLKDEQVKSTLQVDHCAALHQIHGGNVVYAQGSIERDREGDALITDQPGIALSVRWADCQNFILYDPITHTLGAVHAGWRGLLADAIPNTIKAMQSRWSVHPGNLIICAGPSLCMDCASFSDPESELPGIDARLYESNKVNLRGIAQEQLIEAGVSAENIQRHPDCTRCNPTRYWTYRGGDREEVPQGCVNVIGALLQ